MGSINANYDILSCAEKKCHMPTYVSKERNGVLNMLGQSGLVGKAGVIGAAEE